MLQAAGVINRTARLIPSGSFQGDNTLNSLGRCNIVANSSLEGMTFPRPARHAITNCCYNSDLVSKQFTNTACCPFHSTRSLDVKGMAASDGGTSDVGHQTKLQKTIRILVVTMWIGVAHTCLAQCAFLHLLRLKS